MRFFNIPGGRRQGKTAKMFKKLRKSGDVEITVCYDDSNPMMVGQTMRLVLGDKLYALEITEAEFNDLGYADLKLKLLGIEDLPCA
jgi:hypothetical protein